MQIYLLLTERCNLNCNMCIRGKQAGSDINLDQLRQLMQSDAFSAFDVVLTGGEPTLYPHFREVVDITCRHAKTVTVTSNGTIDSWMDGNILQHDNLLFQISIDGDEPTHEAIRGSGTFQAAMRTIERLNRQGYRYSIASVVSKKNVQTMVSLSRILAELPNMQHWKISYEMPFGSCGADDMMTASEWNSFVEEIILTARCRLKVKKIFPFDLYDNVLSKGQNRKERCSNCGCVRDKLYVYPDFNVYPCTCLTNFCIGNLLEYSLEEILSSKAAEPFCNYQVRGDSICFSCPYLDYCNGGCIGMSYHRFGVLGMGDVRCPRLGAE